MTAVGLTPPDLFALGAKIGIFICSNSSLATGCDGTLMAIVLLPWDNNVAKLFFFVCKIIVNGPGQYLSVKILPVLVNSPYFSASFLLKVCTISGLFDGRFFALYILLIAFLILPIAPSP